MTTAYIIKTYRASERTKEYVDNLLKDFSKADYQFFIHILNGTLVSYSKWENGWVPMPSKLIKKHWVNQKIDYPRMVDQRLLEIKILDEFEVADGNKIQQTYSKQLGLCQEFRVHPEIFESIVSCSPKTPEEFDNCKYYNLMTGKAMKAPVKRYPRSDKNNNPLPDLILEAMDTIHTCKLNVKAVLKHLEELEWNISFWYNFGDDSARRAYIIDKTAYDHIMENKIKQEGDFVEYRVIFSDENPQMSGRISEAKIGLQSCSREMKAAAFSGIPGLKNYDLKSSQVYGLIQWFEMADIDTKWLHEYLSKDKQEYADAVGISKDRWKQCFMALIMGGHVRKNVDIEQFQPVKSFKEANGQRVEIEEPPSEAIFKALFEEAKSNPDLAMNYYCNFYKIIEPLKKSIDKWHNWLLNEYVKNNSIYPRGKQAVVNKTGTSFDLTPYQDGKGDWKDKNKLKRKLAAFYLQGTEAGLIHHLTVLSKKYGYVCLSNQHDGLVTIGDIPQEAVDIAKERSGLKYAYLEEKPFV
jgi:hypothetical protein